MRLHGNYISNLPADLATGGWSGMNVAVYEGLRERFDLTYVGPIDPRPDWPRKAASKLWRIAGRPGGYHTFSPGRLKAIAHAVDLGRDRRAEFDFFHGFTPWIACRLERPSFAFADACFDTYMRTYHPQASFAAGDLDRIRRRESDWVARLDAAFFSSQYALGDMAASYGLDASHCQAVGLGANLEVPAADIYSGGLRLLFVAVDFLRKGGPVCLEAFRRVRRSLPEAELTVVGERPADAGEEPGVHWAGRLRKENQEERRTLTGLFASAFALVLPTTSDMTPLVIAEAGIHGCPTVAPRSFGIPEMIRDGVTGALVEAPPRADLIAVKLISLFGDEARYRAMRQAVRAWCLERFSWSGTVDRMAEVIQRGLRGANARLPVGAAHRSLDAAGPPI